jgi:hypothetical protein
MSESHSIGAVILSGYFSPWGCMNVGNTEENKAGSLCGSEPEFLTENDADYRMNCLRTEDVRNNTANIS